MSANLTKASQKSRLLVSSLLPRIAIYSAVVAGIISSLYDFKLNTFSFSIGTKSSSEAKQYIARINKGQQAYYAKNGQFSNDIAKLGLGIKEHTDNYNYTIVSSMGPVQTLQTQRKPAQFESAIAIAKPNDMKTGKSYTSAVFAFKPKWTIQIITIAGVCESNSVNPSYAVIWNPPTFDGKEIRCQPGTTMLIGELR
ncbi:type IV pilin-like G/H family protein [Lyngbya sp. CCAP 1446/10]|uniref:type IV pilin-like G/H family protein n=1 Tax=Lyngbya sp. CCAP 1446/10 TaxID=439293 RepID=UPI002237210B|nr:type IV pilin-like G/H family protein [Lyngbya sp. CCAP 1446/10]MCW6051393.1 type IV pilin-like G/H family protein [Lyngbya sp. CCAP 1446/10]